MVSLLERVSSDYAQRVQSGLAAAMSGGMPSSLPTSAKVPSSHLPSLRELQVKQSTTIIATPDAEGDATGQSQQGTQASAATLGARLSGQTGGGQPGMIKGTLAHITQGVSQMMQGGQQS